MRGLGDALAGLLSSVVSTLVVVTVMLLVLRRYLPFLGRPLWRSYQRGLRWCAVAPWRVLRALVRAATAHHR